nr:MAG TPA: major capsid protein [Caudoviricetes sp.]
MYKELNAQKQKDAVMHLQLAMESNDKEKVKEAWEEFHQSIVDMVMQDYEETRGNDEILMQRGYRVLTKEEKEYYEKLIEVGKMPAKQAVTVTMPIMPETVIEDVYKELTEEHPILSQITFTNVKFLTHWIMNDHTADTAVWGEIDDEIAKEISSSFKEVQITQCKLSAFAMIGLGTLELGPTFLDGYIRTFLKDALAAGLAKGIVTGDGNKCPIGLDRDIHEGVSVSGNAYPRKTKVKVKSFMPKEYGAILAKMATTEKGRKRKFDKVTLVCNMTDYLTKVMPATTVLNGMGGFTNNLFPFPTETVVENTLSDGEAIVFLPKEYFLGVSQGKEGAITYSDEFKFLDEKRVYKIKMYAMGKAYDNTCAVLLDISGLDPAYITVMQKNETPTM